MNNTPKTKSAANKAQYFLPHTMVVPVEVCRALETELMELKAQMPMIVGGIMEDRENACESSIGKHPRQLSTRTLDFIRSTDPCHGNKAQNR